MSNVVFFLIWVLKHTFAICISDFLFCSDVSASFAVFDDGVVSFEFTFTFVSVVDTQAEAAE